MPPFYVEFYCPRQNPQIWQRWGSGLFNRAGRSFADFGIAQQTADSLIWRYHSARVVDSAGNLLYQV